MERALRLGELAEKTSQPDAAIGFYQAALEGGAGGADAQRIYNSLVALYHARQDFDAESRMLFRAVDDERLSESASTRASRLVQAADLYRKRLGRPEEAQKAYERALTLDPLHLAALDSLQALAEAADNWEEVANVLSRKVAATQKRPAQQKAILGRLAQLQAEKLGRPDAAREAYARALALDPDFRPALVFLCDEARQSGKRDDERRHLERLVAQPADPIDSEARPSELTRLGQLQLAAGQVAEAETSARRALELSPRHARALHLLDEVLTRSGDHGGVGVAAPPAGGAGDRSRAELRAALTASGAARSAGTALGGDRRLAGAHAAATECRSGVVAAGGAVARRGPVGGAVRRLGAAGGAPRRRGTAQRSGGALVEASHLLHDKLNDQVRAKQMLEQALEVQPKSKVAISGLLTLALGRATTPTKKMRCSAGWPTSRTT